MGIREFLKRVLFSIDAAHRDGAVAMTGLEVKELENIFALLLLGSFVGLPAPPTFLAVELLPFMERELKVLGSRAREEGDMLAEMAGTIGID